MLTVYFFQREQIQLNPNISELEYDVTASIRDSEREQFTACIEKSIDNPNGVWNKLKKLLPSKNRNS